jgi:TrwC relaxase
MVPNLVQGVDGRWGTLDARHLYAHRITAGYLYQAELRHQLTNTLGVAQCSGSSQQEQTPTSPPTAS